MLSFSHLMCLQTFTRKLKTTTTWKRDETLTAMCGLGNRFITRLSQSGNHAHRCDLTSPSQQSEVGGTSSRCSLNVTILGVGEGLQRRATFFAPVQDWRLKLEPRAPGFRPRAHPTGSHCQSAWGNFTPTIQVEKLRAAEISAPDELLHQDVTYSLNRKTAQSGEGWQGSPEKEQRQRR